MPPGPTLDAVNRLARARVTWAVAAAMQNQVTLGTKCSFTGVKGGIAPTTSV
jgi:hypothetical protein